MPGACQGNGILLDITDPVRPVRLNAVSDPNFSYWRSATFNNDGSKVLFSDEWGGGMRRRAGRPIDGSGAPTPCSTSSPPDGIQQLLQAAGSADDAGELRGPQLLPSSPCRVATSSCRRGTRADCRSSTSPDTANPTDRILRPRTDHRPGEPDRPEPRRTVVDVLVQRTHLRHRDRPRLRHVRPGGRAIWCCSKTRSDAAAEVQLAAFNSPAAVGELTGGAELRRRRRALRPSGAQRRPQ